jgi:outer membrane receptor protein involved in Fe transport
MNVFLLKKKRVLVFLLTILSVLLQAQTAVISGVVKDKETGQPIEDVIVSIEKTNSHTHTNVTGQFYVISLSPGMYAIEFNKFGYEKQQLNIELTDNEKKQLTVELLFNTSALAAVAIESDKLVSAASSSYISKLDFENRPKNSAQDMLRLVPGLFIAQHAGGGKAEQIFIRGFDCDHGTDVATFVDGMPVNMPSHGHGQGYEDLHFLIPEIVKGMTIFKGPYAPQYGDFSTGATVQFNTMDTLENNLFQLESAYIPTISAITAKRGLMMYQLPPMNSKVTSYLAADIINNRGYFENSQHFNRFNIFSKTLFTINEHSNLSFSASGFGSSWDASGQVPERAVKSGLITRFGSLDNTEGGTTQRNNLNLVYRANFKRGEFETQVYSSNYRFKLFSNFTFNLQDSIHGDEIEQGDNRIIRGLNAHYTIPHQLGKMINKFTLGTSFRADEIENNLWHAVKRQRLEVRADALIHERSTAIYANEIFRFSDHFRVELGGRYDYFIFDVEDQLPTDSARTNYSGFNYQTLFSPKLNAIYSVTDHLQFFLNSGSSYHSNDARSVVQEKNNHQLPRAWGAELGSLVHAGNRFIFSTAFWWLDVENELVYVGDDGTIENKGASRRTGIDFSARCQLTSWLFADIDINVSKNIFIDKVFGVQLKTDYHIPLAPTITSAGGLTAKTKKGMEAGIRYRCMAARPANESNTIVAHGYTIFDASINFKIKHFKIGLVAENIFNVNWNEAQFDTESKLSMENKAVDELNFTSGTPFAARIILGYAF